MNVLKPHLQTTIRTLLDARVSLREIERVTGVDRKTIRAWRERFAQESANSPVVATDSNGQIPPPRPPTPPTIAPSACEPYRDFIEAQLRLKRNATVSQGDLVSVHDVAPPTFRAQASELTYAAGVTFA